MTTAFRILYGVIAFVFFLVVWCVCIALGQSSRGRGRNHREH